MFIARAPGSPDVDTYLAEEAKTRGFTPDYAHRFTSRPDVARAWRQLVMTVRTGMERRVFELATIAAARARHSTYCTVAHSMFLRDVCSDDATVRALDADPTGASLGARDAAIYRYATNVATDAASIRQVDIDGLRSLGLSDQDIADIAYAVGARLFFTSVLDGLGSRLDRATAEAFEPGLLAGMIVGRPVGA